VIAILSDIHANAVAMEAVLDDMKSLGIKTALCLGDTVGYGPEPGPCVALVREHCVASVMGNHEAMLFVIPSFIDLPDDDAVSQSIILAEDQLDDGDALPWAKGLPIAIDLDAFEIVHASLHDPPGFPYINEPATAAENFLAQKRPVSFHGHTHFPAVWERSETGKIRCYAPEEKSVLDPDRMFAINPGSIGQPRDGDPRSSYMAYDYSTGTLLHRRVQYDIEKAARRFRKAGMAAFSRTRLRKGQ
jgi:diadenosine tetraphosphatase ApaH/serine/threonine PP2A family protein phosphatase